MTNTDGFANGFYRRGLGIAVSLSPSPRLSLPRSRNDDLYLVPIRTRAILNQRNTYIPFHSSSDPAVLGGSRRLSALLLPRFSGPLSLALPLFSLYQRPILDVSRPAVPSRAGRGGTETRAVPSRRATSFTPFPPTWARYGFYCINKPARLFAARRDKIPPFSYTHTHRMAHTRLVAHRR